MIYNIFKNNSTKQKLNVFSLLVCFRQQKELNCEDVQALLCSFVFKRKQSLQLQLNFDTLFISLLGLIGMLGPSPLCLTVLHDLAVFCTDIFPAFISPFRCFIKHSFPNVNRDFSSRPSVLKLYRFTAIAPNSGEQSTPFSLLYCLHQLLHLNLYPQIHPLPSTFIPSTDSQLSSMASASLLSPVVFPYSSSLNLLSFQSDSGKKDSSRSRWSQPDARSTPVPIKS